MTRRILVRVIYVLLCTVVLLFSVVISTESSSEDSEESEKTDHSTEEIVTCPTSTADYISDYANKILISKLEEFISDDSEDVTEETPEEIPEDFMTMTEEDLRLFSSAIYLESGSTSKECQLVTGSVILNRMITRGMTLHDVLYEKNGDYYQFSVAPLLSSTTPNELSIEVAEELLKNGPVVPYCVTFFKTDSYHSFNPSLIVGWSNIDNVYFSHDLRYCDCEGGCNNA